MCTKITRNPLVKQEGEGRDAGIVLYRVDQTEQARRPK